ncbi:Tm-1-like ATP-binding domain-containing protein [Lawsonibacter sp. JLR.KK007]|jgi:uncharacterized protein (UPF0261 family)|uniref:Tm-1-like ATP-binding domain-containing protein n=1 Tax=Lawsonibacter sp. JLR.KK007 TaxID=3114293 RepID=UPI002FF311C1
MGKVIAIFGTMDTKGEDYFFLKEKIEEAGLKTLLIDTGLASMAAYPCDVSSEEVIAAGGSSTEEIRRHERTYAFEVIGHGSTEIVCGLCRKGAIDGVISMGGGQGTLLAVMVMRELPVGFPKVLVSTIANLRTLPFEGVNDTVVMNSLVDISGSNGILRMVMTNAAHAIVGMVEHTEKAVAARETKKPRVGITMFGITTPCVERVCAILKAQGFEVVVFHVNGQGGKMLERMIREGMLNGVLDVTTGELGQEYMGGTCTAGCHRLEAGPERGIPMVVVPGALTNANFMPPSTVPEKYQHNKAYLHNPNLVLVRADQRESVEIGRIFAEKINRCTGPVEVLLPERGTSLYDSPGGPLYDEAANRVMFDEICRTLRSDIPVVRMDVTVNDEAFAVRIAEDFLKLYHLKGNGEY